MTTSTTIATTLLTDHPARYGVALAAEAALSDMIADARKYRNFAYDAILAGAFGEIRRLAA